MLPALPGWSRGSRCPRYTRYTSNVKHKDITCIACGTCGRVGDVGEKNGGVKAKAKKDEGVMVRVSPALRDRAWIVAKRKKMELRDVIDAAVEDYVKKNGE